MSDERINLWLTVGGLWLAVAGLIFAVHGWG